MKFLKQFLLMAVVVFGLSMTAMAQRDDNQNRPKKPDPPIIDPRKKDPPKPDKPREDNNQNRPKKPQDAIFVSGNRAGIGLV